MTDRTICFSALRRPNLLGFIFTRLLPAVALVGGMCHCSKPVLRKAPDSADASSPASTLAAPTAITSTEKVGTGATISSRQPSVAPKNVYYVIKRFSVMSESGVTGFAPGKQVTLIKETANGLLITDGIVQAVVPKPKLTNNLQVLNTVLSQGEILTSSPPLPATQPAPIPADAQAAKFQEAKRRIALNKAKLADEKKQVLGVRQKKQLQADLADLNKRIKAAQAEIEEKKSTQRPVRRTYDVWGNLISYQGRSMYTLSADASGLSQLIAKRDKTAEQLADLE